MAVGGFQYGMRLDPDNTAGVTGRVVGLKRPSPLAVEIPVLQYIYVPFMRIMLTCSDRRCNDVMGEESMLPRDGGERDYGSI